METIQKRCGCSDTGTLIDVCTDVLKYLKVYNEQTWNRKWGEERTHDTGNLSGY